MKPVWSRILACLLTLGLLLSSAVAEPAGELDFTVEQKLVKQLQAGSGFEGTLTLESSAVAGSEAQAFTTLKPLTFDVTYLYVRPDVAAKTDGETRMTLALTDGEQTLGKTEASLQTGLLAFSSTLLGDGWYTLNTQTAGEAASGNADGSALGEKLRGLIGATAMPGLMTFAAGAVAGLEKVDTTQFTGLLDPYTTKIDLWLEGYRQNAVMGKTADGTTTMEINYQIPATAMKAQLKQLVMDLLKDDALLKALSAAIPASYVAQYLDPAQQEYYFYTIDELPLKDDLSISRTVSLKGDTLALSLSLPMYDSKGGEATLRYSRKSGMSDLPDENTLELQTGSRLLRVTYQTYSTLTGTTVYQGAIFRGSADGKTEPANGEKAFSASFTLSSQMSNSTDEQGKDKLTRSIQLTFSPEYTPDDTQDDVTVPTDAQKAAYVTFTPLELQLDTAFTSGQAKNSSTNVDFTLTVSSEQLPEVIKATFSGKTKSKWTLDAMDLQNATAIDGMDAAALGSLLAQAGVKGGLLLLPYLGLPTNASGTTPTATDTASVSPDATLIPTVAPPATATAEPATTEATPAATVTAEPTATEATPTATEGSPAAASTENANDSSAPTETPETTETPVTSTAP